MSGSGFGLQGELTAAAAAMQGHDSPAAFSERLGRYMTTAKLSEALYKFDAVSLLLLVVTLVAFFVPVFILFPPIPVERSDALRQTHSRIGLSPRRRSNLRAQSSGVHSSQPGKPPHVQSLHIYPIKSCKGIEVRRSRVLDTGFQYDRLYTFAQQRSPRPASSPGIGDANSRPAWEFLTQRQLPLLANVCVDLWVPDAGKTSRQLGKVEEAFLVVRFPWIDNGWKGLTQWLAAKVSRGFHAIPEKEFMLPVAFPSQSEIKARGYSYADIKVWTDVATALNLESEIPMELSRYLGAKHRLGIFRIDPSQQRDVTHGARPNDMPGCKPALNFQDDYPLNLLGLSSMQDLDTLILKDETMKCLDARRFRPNIIVTGSDKYEEDAWKTINLKNPSTSEECQLEVACRTTRCKLPNVDPNTGIRHKVEPDRALRKFRNVDEEAPKSGCLGVQLCPVFPPNTGSDEIVSYIEVGMEIEILKGDLLRETNTQQ
ncbi:hypothetical protein BGZ63DRAFT_381192 [Mariannaea sp. PMI_226]|nr:hypothetical protein BGZ63DRAFT_381192 [Mariannaea sp. PMI_226]